MPTRRVLSPRTLRRAAVALAIAATAALVVGLGTGVALVRRPLPATDGSVSVPGLDGRVTVLRDERGVPQIYADTADDLFRAQGYVHAQDRFFEMDWRRHLAAGRLAELVGDDQQAIAADRVVRTLGWRRVAEAELEAADVATRQHLDAYARGVNDYLRGRSASRLSLSYPLLGLSRPMPTIEPWTPVDSLSWFKVLAWDLTGDYRGEIDRVLALATVKDARRVDQLYPGHPSDRSLPSTSPAGGALPDALLPDAALPDAAAQRAFERAGAALAAVPTGGAPGSGTLRSGKGIGASAWAVSGRLTATGKPLLVSDPQLAPALPGVWYQVGLHCRSVSSTCPFDVAGFSFSGVPGVVVGHNGRIAWGLSDLGPDVTDLFLEKVTGDRVERDGSLVALDVRTETVKVAGAPDQTVTVRTGPHGPLLSDGDGYAVALSWTALVPGHALDAVLGLNAAQDLAAFRAAALRWDAPAQRLVFADVDGHIGYQAAGRIPRRAVPTDGRWPLPGWTSTHDWKGYTDVADLPRAQDPADGLVVTASRADDEYRAQRLRELLADRTGRGAKLTVADLEAVQADTRNPMAAELVPLLLRVRLGDSFYDDAVRLLRGWDGDQPVDSPAAAYFNAVWSSLLSLTFDDELPAGSRPDGGGRWFDVVRALLKSPDDPWWDDRGTASVVETRDEILRRALVQARDRLTKTVGKDPSTWAWGHLHKVAFVDTPLGASDRTAVIHSLLNEGPVELPGGTGLVNAQSWDAARRDWRITRAPSMRMVVDLGDLDRSRWVNQTGQSGHPGSAHYLDQLDAWAQGRTFSWPFSSAAVERSTEDTLTLEPRTGS